jgi:hypothetical protein
MNNATKFLLAFIVIANVLIVAYYIRENLKHKKFIRNLSKGQKCTFFLGGNREACTISEIASNHVIVSHDNKLIRLDIKNIYP